MNTQIDEDREIKCEYCNDTGIMQLYDGTDYDDWTVVDTKPCPYCKFNSNKKDD